MSPLPLRLHGLEVVLYFCHWARCSYLLIKPKIYFIIALSVPSFTWYIIFILLLHALFFVCWMQTLINLLICWSCSQFWKGWATLTDPWIYRKVQDVRSDNGHHVRRRHKWGHPNLWARNPSGERERELATISQQSTGKKNLEGHLPMDGPRGMCRL